MGIRCWQLSLLKVGTLDGWFAPHVGRSDNPAHFSIADMKGELVFGGHGLPISVQVARGAVAPSMLGQGCSPSLARCRDGLERADLPG